MKKGKHQIITIFFLMHLLVACSDSTTDAEPEPEPGPMPVFSFQITVADRVSKIDLNFGLDTNTNLINKQAPPAPPDGALNAFFERDQSMWITDFRNPTENQYQWNLKFRKGQFEPLLIYWELLSEKDTQGNFILESNLNQQEIDMKVEDSIELSPQNEGIITIEYRVTVE